MYIVVENECENCGEVNAHLTVDCESETLTDRVMRFIHTWSSTIVFFVGRLA